MSNAGIAYVPGQLTPKATHAQSGGAAFLVFLIAFLTLFCYEGPGAPGPQRFYGVYKRVSHVEKSATGRGHSANLIVTSGVLSQKVNSSVSTKGSPTSNGSPSVKPNHSVQKKQRNSLQKTVPLGAPLLALVIDDWGNPTKYASDFLQMNIPLTAAIIPNLPASEKHATQATAVGFDVLLHLPMEPENSNLRTKGMVTTGMSDEAIRQLVQSTLRTIPGVVGVNNHMGSKATTDPRVMRAVLGVLKDNDMFYLDSRTTAHSQGAAVATSMGVSFLENAAFLDDKADVDYIHERLLYAAKLAKERGSAVAIGHVRQATAQAITATLPEIAQMGIQLVRVSELIRSTRPTEADRANVGGTVPLKPVQATQDEKYENQPAIEPEAKLKTNPESQQETETAVTIGNVDQP